MADDSDVMDELGTEFIEGGQGEESAGAGESIYASEDDGGEPEGGEPEPQPEPEERAAIAARLAEKERQAHGLTVALRQMREENRIMHQRLALVLERAMAQPQGEEEEGEEEPDPEADAVGAIRHDVRRVGEELRARLEAIEERENGKVIESQVEDTVAWVRNDAAAFAEQYPDYPEVAQFVAHRMQEGIRARLRFENPTADPERIEQAAHDIFARELANIHLRYRRLNQSFAAAVYQAAAGAGYRPNNGGGQRRQGGGSSLAEARRRVAASRTLNMGGGSGGPRRPLSRRDVVSMSDDEFAALLESGAVDFKQIAAAIGESE